MIIRQALFLGNVSAKDQPRFDQHMAETVLPLLKAMPGVAAAHVLRCIERDDNAPETYQIIQLRFRDRAALAAMQASPERQAVHGAMAEILPLFDGSVTHLVSEVVAGAR